MGKKHKKQNISGQASILFGLMSMTFMLLAVFVINTGMLVHAKINLQNAADLAAYAGAATQARQLNSISYLNYEMRRQYKKFLFRYYVVGNMAQAGFPNHQAGSDGFYSFSPSGGGTSGDSYNLPVVCVIFNGKDNYCKIRVLESLAQTDFGNNPLDPVMSAFAGQIQRLEEIRKKNCQSIGFTNRKLLELWIYNTDPTLENLLNQIQASNDPELLPTLKTIRSAAYGLGLLPANVLLNQRIATLKDYVNYPPQTGMTFSAAQTLQESSEDTAAPERPLQAFFSAFHTLGENLFVDNSIVMDELLPVAGNGANLLQLEVQKPEFNTYFVNFLKPNPGQVITAESDCTGFADSLLVKNIPLSVYKKPQVLTYYAVRLKAKAKILFSPFGDIDLKAYSAAQPFGSRIGPTDEQFVLSGIKPAGPDNPDTIDETAGIPNLPVLSAKEGSIEKGWRQSSVLSAFYQKFTESGGTQKTILGPEDMERAYAFAMAPNPWEKGKFNIINDLGEGTDQAHSKNGDYFNKFFGEGLYYALWAPIVPPGKSGEEANQVIIDMIDSFTSDPTLSQAVKATFENLLSQMRAGDQINQQSYHVARLNDPFRFKHGNTVLEIDLPNDIMMKNEGDVRTSWSDNDTETSARGRTGYSVKYISFQTLLQKQGVTTNGTDIWTNDLPLDAEAAQDLGGGDFIQH